MGRVYQMVQETPEPVLESATPVIIRPQFEDEGYTIVREDTAVWRVQGGKIERAAARTRTEYHEALLRFHHYLEAQGVIDALREAGVREGTR